MGKKILILDDDADFNSLLTDIFEQADYEVTSEQDPEHALRTFEEDDFDLVVTDQKMPRLTGAEFMNRIREIDPEIPVIMVSGYLDNDTIRDLIREGVGGVFLKPLNVFSLLKRTTELIEEQGNRGNLFEGVGGESGSRMRTYPCKAGDSAAFASKLKDLRDFKTNLLLVCEQGIPARQICEDFRELHPNPSREAFEYLKASNFNAEEIDAVLRKHRSEDLEHLTIVLLDGVEMEGQGHQLFGALSKKQGDYEDLGFAVRFIFSLAEDLDTLFERGVIDDNLYIMLGTAEAKAPPLRQCPEDIPILAQQYIVDAVTEKGLSSVPRIDRTGREYLRDQPWPGNHQELRAVVFRTVGQASKDVLSAEDFSGAGAAVDEGAVESLEGFSASLLYEKLKDYRDSYLRGLLRFADGDAEIASELVSVSPDLFQEVSGSPRQPKD
jgi:DNA-binding NtrC family response regulator